MYNLLVILKCPQGRYIPVYGHLWNWWVGFPCSERYLTVLLETKFDPCHDGSMTVCFLYSTPGWGVSYPWHIKCHYHYHYFTCHSLE